ncbi:MAG: hypothetical protein ACRYG8_52935 [Janthinobacterium lividum]
MTTIRISKEEAERLRDVKLDEFYLDLVKFYPGFDSMPEAAKIGLFDMIYNIGPALPHKFHLLDRAVRSRDWRRLSHRASGKASSRIAT